MSSKRTTKRVTVAVTATFHGDYIDADEVTGRLQGWIDAGLDDRDDLRHWSFTAGQVFEVHGDPEGFDS